MFKFISLALLAVFASAATKANLDVERVTFSSFAKMFHPNLHVGSVEWHERLSIFEAEVRKIRTHNADSKKSFTMGLNKFSASTQKEKRVVLGRRADMEQAHEPKKVIEEHGFTMKPIADLPVEIDWTETLGTAVKDQGHCGSCFAFAASAMLEDYTQLSTGLQFNLSPQMGASCTPNPGNCGGSGGCEGGTAEIIFDYLANGGGIMAQEYQYGYTAYYGEDPGCHLEGIVPTINVGGFTLLQGNNYTELMNAVAQMGPVSIGVDASEWHSYEGGVFNGCNQKNPDVNHAVVLYGYGVDSDTGLQYWKVRNSWSPTYGESGFIRIFRADDESEVCGIQLNPQDNDACEGDYKPRKVCGTCGILSGSSYLQDVTLYSP